MKNLSNKDFNENYLFPLGFEHDGPGSRSPSGLLGRKESGNKNLELTDAPVRIYKLQNKDSQRENASIQPVNISINLNLFE